MDVSSLESTGVVSGIAALGLGLILFLAAILVGVCVFMLITYIKLFKKCGQPGWAAIIPGYNYWVECKMVGCHWVVFAGMICSLLSGNFDNILGSILSSIGVFASVLFSFNLAKKFGKDTGFVVGLVLLPIVFIPILAFGKNNVFNAEAEVKNCGFFSVNF